MCACVWASVGEQMLGGRAYEFLLWEGEMRVGGEDALGALGFGTITGAVDVDDEPEGPLHLIYIFICKKERKF